MLSKHKIFRSHRNKPKDNWHRLNNGIRIKSFFLLALIFVSTIIALPIFQNSIASAATTSISTGFKSPNAIDWQIKSFLYANVIQSCLARSQLENTVFAYQINDDNAKTGKWFLSYNFLIHGVGGLLTIPTKVDYAGLYMTGISGVAADGVVKCDDASFISSALSFWGLTSTEVLCNSGFYKIGTDKSLDNCLNSPLTKGFTYGLFTNSNTIATKFGNYMRTKVYGLPDGNTDKIDLTNIYPDPLPSNPSSPILYIFYREILSQSCIKTVKNQPSLFGTGTSLLTGDTNYNNVSWIDTTQTPAVDKPGAYYGDLKQSDSINLGLYAYPPLGQFVKCVDIVTAMNGAKNGYLNWYNSVYSKLSAEEKKKEAELTAAAALQSGKDSCGIQSVGWILCPVINFLGFIVDQSWGVLEGYLKTDIQIVRGTGTGSTYSAWKVMQGIANVAFVIAFLIIIFSQITSIGITNYGIKKMLPRLIIAAILVNVSFYICQIAVDISNISGSSLKNLLDGLAGSVYRPQFSPSANVPGVIAGVIGAGAGVAILYASLGTLIPMLLAGVVAVVMILFILIARQALIVILIVISPLAFVAYLLPNTEKLFQKWQKTFTSMLLLYPIVALVIGGSSFAATILTNAFSDPTNSSNSTLGQIAVSAVAILPLFIIPGLLKKALDGVGGIGAKLNGLSDKWGKKAGDKYTNSDLAKNYAAKLADKQSRIATGSYRGAGKFNVNNLRSGFNRAKNNHPLYNKVTSGLGGKRDLVAQAQDKKDQQEVMSMFRDDDVLASAWADSGGNKKHASYSALGALTDSQKLQFDKMVSAGHHRKAASHLAAVQYLSENGKGTGAQADQALAHARSMGASDTDMSSAAMGAITAYRKSGRGDALSELSTLAAARGIDGVTPVGSTAAWNSIATSSVNRVGIDPVKNPAGLAQYTASVASSETKTTEALRGFSGMDSRAQGFAEPAILAAALTVAANRHTADIASYSAAMASYPATRAAAIAAGAPIPPLPTPPTPPPVAFTTIDQARQHLGIR